MKILLFILAFFCFNSSLLFALDENVNVLSYYGVNNSLDGQLKIERINVLRFFPIFAFQDSTDSVQITIYYGGNIYTRKADRKDNGRYWEALLPIFRLGEAIQKIEVKTHFMFDGYILKRYPLTKQFFDSISPKKDDLSEKLVKSQSEFNLKKKENDKKFERLNVKPSIADSLSKHIVSILSLYDNDQKQNGELDFTIYDSEQFIKKVDSFEPSFKDSLTSFFRENIESLNPYNTLITDSTSNNKYTKEYYSSYMNLCLERLSNQQDYINNTEKYNEEINDLFKPESAGYNAAIAEFADTIEKKLTDTSYTGPGVKKSDIIIDRKIDGATILYRNYKSALREMGALDPAEELGIFRIRYIPFPILSTKVSPRTSLRGSLSGAKGGGNIGSVFEVGLAFGNRIEPGDDFVPDNFSLKRLGIAFAITEKLFNEDAEVIAVALTYDVNSYASIGFGVNVAQQETHEYFSFGINKKAFEGVVASLAKLFK